MEKLSLFRNLSMDRLSIILVNLFVFFLPYDQFYTTIILYLWILVAILNFKFEKIKRIPKQFWIFQGIIYLSFIGYFYSNNKSEASFLIERQLVFIILPILIPLSIEFKKKNINQIISTLQYANLVALLLIVLLISYKAHLLGINITELPNSFYFNQEFLGNIGIHATYFSVLIAFSFLTTLYHYFNNGKNWLDLIITIILFLSLYFLSTHIIIILVSIVLLFVFPFLVKQKKRYFFFLLSTIAITVTFSLNSPVIQECFNNNSKVDLSLIDQAEKTNIESRIDRWKICLNVIKEAPFFGYGTGDEIDILKTEYKNHFYIKSQNAHNQYLSILIKHGIVGLLFFILLFTYYLSKAFKNRNGYYAIFLIIILSIFITENVLDTDKGIFIFVFFNTLLGYDIIQKKRGKKKPLIIGIIDPVGKKAGMDYYDIELQKGLTEEGSETYIFSNFSTNKKHYNYFPSFISNKLLYLALYIISINRSLIKAKTKKVNTVILHSFSAELKDLILYFSCKLYGLKIFTIAHDISGFSNNDKKWILFLIYKQFSKYVMVHNDFSKKQLITLLKDDKNLNIVTIPHGHFLNLPKKSITKQDARKKLKISQNEQMILFFGQIKKQKGLDILIEAMSKTNKKYNLTIAGKPWKEMFDKYDRIINEYNIKAHTRKMIHYIPDYERELLFKACDIVVIPYREIYQSGVLLMALSYEKMVIVSDLEANKEIIRNNENGYLFETNNSSDLANKIDNFFDLDEAQRSQFSKNATSYIKKNHDWNIIASRIINSIIL